MELTKEHFDESLKTLSDKFVTKEHFDGTINKLTTKITDIELSITGIESNITGIKAAVNKMATQESLDDLRDRITPIEQTLSRHTTLLDKIQAKLKLEY